MTEHSKIEGIWSRRSPQTEGIDGLAAEANDRPVVWDADQLGRPARNGVQAPATHLERAVKRHLNLLLRTSYFPRVRVPQPIIRLLLLPPVFGALLEYAIFVPQPIAHCRERHGSHG